jgi:hypothetical protein
MVLCISNSKSKGLVISIRQSDTVTVFSCPRNCRALVPNALQKLPRANYMMVRVRGLESWGIPSLLAMPPF